MHHLSSLTLDRFFSEQLPVFEELLFSEKEPKREFFVKTVDEYLIKNPVDIRVGYILCRSAQWSRYSKKPFLRHRDAGWELLTINPFKGATLLFENEINLI